MNEVNEVNKMEKILIAIDGSDDSNKALAQGGELAKGMGSEVVLVAVQRSLEDIEYYLPVVSYVLKKTKQEDEKEVKEKFAALGREVLDESKNALEEKGVTNVKTVLKWGRPADGILKAADEEGAELIVVGCRGKHLSKRFLGSVSDEVSERSDVSVLIAR